MFSLLKLKEEEQVEEQTYQPFLQNDEEEIAIEVEIIEDCQVLQVNVYQNEDQYQGIVDLMVDFQPGVEFEGGVLLVQPEKAELQLSQIDPSKCQLYCLIKLGQKEHTTNPHLSGGSEPNWS